MNLSKKYFLEFIFIFLIFQLLCGLTRDYYRSNSNGLMLLKITPSQVNKYSYILMVDNSGDQIYTKTLYKSNSETKKWKYLYNNNILDYEYYYKDKKINEESKYDNLGHKVMLLEYLNGSKFRKTQYSYNSDGVVEKEEIYSYVDKSSTSIKYKYDRDFRIKQIEKKYDNKTVYWESFFTDKGIIIKEYYSLKNEMFTFLYNENGQELKGEVKDVSDDKNEKVKIQWENFYSKDGTKDRKVEDNFVIGKRVISWYYKNAKERRIETYYNEELTSIEEFEYNEKDKVSYYKKVYDLNISEIYYKYNTNFDLLETKQYDDKLLKKITTYNPDGSRSETIISKNNLKITTDFDKDGNIKN
jgi:hypothetical protein